MSYWEGTTVDGRYVRLELNDSPRPSVRIFVDGEPIDSAGAAYRHEDNRYVLVTGVGEFEFGTRS